MGNELKKEEELAMNKATSTNIEKAGITNHRFFARIYERLSRGSAESSFMNPLRQETAGQARGLVLEIGPGNGLNFSFYDPTQVERVEAVEPDTSMLSYARQRLESARVPINLVQAAAENLPFAAATFDTVVATLVFCSVTDPERGLQEIRRVLKPGGTLYMVEHVRSSKPWAARVQDIITPVIRRVSGNCHWNRDTARKIAEAGLHITSQRNLSGILVPMVVLQATYQ
jgi:ubiquinone/menaquinone biosynthesis C-methylase UbiE